MIVDIWNEATRSYTSEEMDIVNPAFCDDMNKPIQCPNCKKTFPYGNGFVSHKYFYKGGVFGMTVCPECYKEER